MEEFKFTPRQWVLVRDSKDEEWCLAQFSNYSSASSFGYTLCGGASFKCCIPYNDDTAHLLGTTDDYVEPWQPKDGDFVVMYEQFIAICKNPQIDEMYGGYKFNVYAYSRLSYTDKFYFSMPCTKQEEIRLATCEEKETFLSKLAETGKKWNPEKKCIEDVWTPKDGDFVTYTYPSGNKYVAIYYCKESDSIDCFYVDFCLKNETEYFVNKTNYKDRFVRGYIERRLATDSEKQQLLDALHKEGKDWNAEKKKIVEYKWRPKHGEKYWFVSTAGEPKVVDNLDIEDRDVNRIKLGNCFRTKEEAQTMADKFKELLKGK